MTPHQMPVLSRPNPSIIPQKVLIIYKLFLLENARNTLEQELHKFTKQVYEDVHTFLNSSLSTSVFGDLTHTLDAKCREIVTLSARLKDVAVEPEAAVRTNYLQPLVVKGNPMTGVLKFGPMLQNSLMASSIAKVVQVLGSSPFADQLKPPLASRSFVDGKLCCMSSSSNNTSTSSCQSKPEEEVVLEEMGQAASVYVPPASREKSNILLPPLQAEFPEIKIRMPLVIWGHGDDVQVQHQKQTSSQLLLFLRERAKNKGVLEVSVLEWTKIQCKANDSPQQASPVKTQSHQLRRVVTDELLLKHFPKALHVNAESQAPVFRVKRVKASGSLIYRCVIATESELWDIGDVFTEVLQEDSELSLMESEDCQNTIAQMKNFSTNIDWKSKTQPYTEPDAEIKLSEMLMHKNINIPEFQIRKFEEAEVVVSHVVSPGNFYIQYAESLEKLQALQTDSCKAIHSYAEQNCIPDIGARVMAWFPRDECWCRAEVLRICGVSPDDGAVDDTGPESSIKVEVKRLDFGDTSCVSLRNMKELTTEMCLLPLQALQVSLANVTPIDGRDWSEEAVGWFRAMVHNRMLYARLYPQGETVTTELFLEKGKLGAMRRGASLSLRLAQNGHAKHPKLKNIGLVKKRAVQDSDWEKYLISCYMQVKKKC